MFSPGRSRSPRSKCTAQKSVSFKMYELEQKTKLKASYPFLSADQIKSRIKDQWHNLAQDEKNKYMKVRLKSTPVKDKQKSNKYQKSYEYNRKRKTNSDVTAVKKQKLEVCPTPEFVNMEKLHDFRTKHTECYDNDFSDSPASQENQTESSLRGWMKTGMVTYEKACFNVERQTPEVIDNNPCQQAGILKTREKAEQPAVTKGRVSFSSPTDVYQLSDVYSDNFSDNDNDGLLIKRNEYNASPLLTEPDIRYSDDSDDDDDDAVLITRQEEDCENTDMTIAEQDEVVNQERNDRKASEVNPLETNQKQSVNQGETSQTLNQPKPKVTKRKLSGANQGNQHKKSPKSKLPKKSDTTETHKRANQEKNQLDVRKDLVADEFDNSFMDKRSDNNEEQFKSPLPDIGKTRLRRGRKRKQEDARSAEVTTPVGSASRLTQLVTPTGAQHVETVNSYTTPQMDEDLQNETLAAAVKAPQKRRQSAPNTTDIEKLRALTAGRRVTRSLIAAKEVVEKMSPELPHTPHDDKAHVAERRRNEVQNNLYQLENACNLMDPSGDARSIVNKRDQTNLTTENKDVSMSIDASYGDEHAEVLDTDKNFKIRSDTPKQPFNALAVDKNLAASVCKTETRNPYLKHEDMFCHRAVGGHQKNGPFKSLSDESSDASQNSEASSASPITALSVNTNPVLEKALRNLRCTGSDSPKILDEKTSTRSSPGILSPALSGVSELSSASSSSVLMDQNTAQGEKTYSTESQENTYSSESQDQKSTQQSLCQMFKDLTPPDKKTAGPYKTQRLVSSSATESKNFKQMFHSDEESLFF